MRVRFPSGCVLNLFKQFRPINLICRLVFPQSLDEYRKIFALSLHYLLWNVSANCCLKVVYEIVRLSLYQVIFKNIEEIVINEVVLISGGSSSCIKLYVELLFLED